MTLTDILHYQKGEYDVARVDNVSAFLEELPANDEDSLYQMSLLREPRAADRADII